MSITHRRAHRGARSVAAPMLAAAARIILALLVLAAATVPAVAQERGAVTKANWALADKFTNQALGQVTYSTSVTPHWIGESDSLWYSWRDHSGCTFYLVAPIAKLKRPLFDHIKLAAQLSTLHHKPIDPLNLPFNTVTFAKDGKTFQFTVEGERFDWEIATETLKLLPPVRGDSAGATGRGAAGAGGGGRGGRGGGRGGQVQNTQQNQQQNQQNQQLTQQQILQQQQQALGGRGGAQGCGTGGGGGAGRAGGGGGGGGGQGGGRGGGGGDFHNYAPDSSAFVFARDHNLFLVEKGKADTIQLTKDGEQYHSFGSRDTTTQADTTDQQLQQQQQQQDTTELQQGGRGGGRGGAAQNRDPRVRPSAVWSPDSKGFYIQRTDSRKVGSLYLVDVLAQPRPTLRTYKYAMPGEENVNQQELWLYKMGDKELTTANVKRWKDQTMNEMSWSTAPGKMRLMRRDRPQRNEEYIELDVATNSTKALFSESVENANLERKPIRVVNKNGDFIWWSERTGWGQFYLYDHDGKLKNAITSGPWRAETIVQLDTVKRIMWVAGVGREGTENPYYTHLYRVNLDGTGMTLLDPGDANHGNTTTAISPTKHFLVDNSSRVDLEPHAVLRDDKGNVVMDLEKMDMLRLKEMGWKAPETFVVKSADGVTNIYGNMWKPFDFDSTKKYPIIANVYPGPQTESVTYTFSATAALQRMAQLGFIMIQIGNRGGSPQRSDAYQSYSYYNLRDYGLADKKAGIEQLAARHPWIDLNRVGIFGHSGGGFMTAAAMLLPPYNDFFKVGWSESGNHDNNVYNQNWSEQYHGLSVVTTPAKANAAGSDGSAPDDDTKFVIHVPTNAELAANLKGNLFLIHGDMDNNVHPAGTIRLMDALIKANKRFDFMLVPGQPHSYGPMAPYVQRRMYEYFAEHLLGDYYGNDAIIR